MASVTGDLLQSPPFVGLSRRMQFAVKVALSMTLAFMLPMALGWPSASTAATTVMVVAASGDMRESMLKGTLRLAGTVLGAVIGLALIACFGQDRLLYLVSASLVVALLLYLRSASKRYGYLFLLAAMVTLMVFNGGHIEHAFEFGINRTHMTLFGVAVYTLVFNLVWPDRPERNLTQLAGDLLARNRELIDRLHDGANFSAMYEQMERVKALERSLNNRWQAVRDQVDFSGYAREWQHLMQRYHDLSRVAIGAFEPPERPALNYAAYIDRYDDILRNLDQQLQAVGTAWQSGDESETPSPPPAPRWLVEPVRRLSHIDRARVIARVAALRELLQIAGDLRTVSRCLSRRGPNLPLPATEPSPASTDWLDSQSIKLGVRALVAFWLGTTLWIALNPPGGFNLVLFTLVMLPLVSFTPLTAGALFKAFSLGFAVALPLYVFVLPALSRGYELAAFIFCYSWLGHYLFQGPKALLFMLGLFTLGIDNTMHYNLAVLLNMVLLFSLVCAILAFVEHFVFCSKPEYLLTLMRRRFFQHGASLLALVAAPQAALRGVRTRYHQAGMAAALSALQLWGSKIDTSYFRGARTEQLAAFGRACELVSFNVTALLQAPRVAFDPVPAAPPVATRLQRRLRSLAARLPTASDRGDADNQRVAVELEEQLNTRINALSAASVREEDIVAFYTLLNRLALLWHAIDHCEREMLAIDWAGLAESRF